MATSESQKKARNKWLRENVEDVKLRVPIGKRAIIQAYAKAHGETVNAFINRVIDEAMAKDDTTLS